MICTHNYVNKSMVADIWQCNMCFAEFIPKPEEKPEEKCNSWCRGGCPADPCPCSCHKPFPAKKAISDLYSFLVELVWAVELGGGSSEEMVKVRLEDLRKRYVD